MYKFSAEYFLETVCKIPNSARFASYLYGTNKYSPFEFAPNKIIIAKLQAIKNDAEYNFNQFQNFKNELNFEYEKLCFNLSNKYGVALVMGAGSSNELFYLHKKISNEKLEELKSDMFFILNSKTYKPHLQVECF